MTVRWSTPAEVHAKVRRRWDDGSLLRSYAGGEAFPVIEVPLRGPRATELGADLTAARQWAEALESGARRGACYELRYAAVGGRLIGRNRIPARALVSSYTQAWAVLGVTDEVRRLDAALAGAMAEPGVREWVGRHPLAAISLDGQWPTLLAAYRWLDEQRGTGRYLREISAPGVDTKFVEQHRSALAGMLDVPAGAGGFLTGLGLAAKPEMIRLRADPSLSVALSLGDVTVPVAALRDLAVAPRSATIVENEITFLTVPVPPGGILLWGKGFEVDRAGSLPWLRGVPVHYWGDLDTHGFAILNRLRRWLPQACSFLMDRETLLAHRDRWVTEGTPTRARLDLLTAQESELYDDLVTDRLGERVRLEQERIDWAWARARFPAP